MDLVRIDCAVWLAREKDGSVELPRQRRGPEAAPGASSDDSQSMTEESTSGAPAPEVASVDAGPSAAHGEQPDRPAALAQVNAFASAMTEGIWQDVVEDLPGSPAEVREIRLELADHGWCDLFIGFVRVLEKFGKAFDEIPDRAKKIIVKTIHRSSRSGKRPLLTKYVVGIIVDKAWAAFKAATVAHSPLLAVLTSEELLRNIRMLAVFTCPAPEKHEEVREHAVEPLADDVQGYVSDQAKEWLTKQFGLPGREVRVARETSA
ncbi:hypothetical protein [Amycolatopsis australiensis]|nr:hypothetical protein [Amycolatopsis australiensis]